MATPYQAQCRAILASTSTHNLRHHSLSLPHLQAAHRRHSSATASSTLTAGRAFPSNTRAFRSSHIALIINMMKELAVFWSLFDNGCTADGHQRASLSCPLGIRRVTSSLRFSQPKLHAHTNTLPSDDPLFRSQLGTVGTACATVVLG